MATGQHNLQVGQWGESLALSFLERRGYALVARNIKTSYKEVDLIMSCGEMLVFVEVKTRIGAGLGSAAEMLTGRKLANLRQAAFFYLGKQHRQAAVRFDFVAIDVDRGGKTAKVKHFKDIL